MSNRTKTGNKADNKNYGGTSIFYGSLLLIDVALIGYNLYFMKIFKEIGQTFYPVLDRGSFLERLSDRYFSFFAQFFGYYPSTKVLAVTIPLAFVFLIWFIDDFSKYLRQKARKEVAAGLFEVTDAPAEQTTDGTVVNSENNLSDEAENKPENTTETDKPDSDNSDTNISE